MLTPISIPMNMMTYDMLRALDVEKDDPEDSASEAESVQYVNKAAVYACEWVSEWVTDNSVSYFVQRICGALFGSIKSVIISN